MCDGQLHFLTWENVEPEAMGDPTIKRFMRSVALRMLAYIDVRNVDGSGSATLINGISFHFRCCYLNLGDVDLVGWIEKGTLPEEKSQS